MPQKNSRKTYSKDTFYHIYNRGVEKRTIFEDEQDYGVFIKYLKEYLSFPINKLTLAKDVSFKGQAFKGIPRQPKNYHSKIELITYCLMPNHYHLLIKNNEKNAINQFIQSMSTRYSMYFNKKYQRVGSLFQSRYKAAIVSDESYLLHLSRYIHQNPDEHFKKLEDAYSSYSDYLGLTKAEWVKPDIILSYFNKANNPLIKSTNTYKRFVEESAFDSIEFVGDLKLE